MRATSRIGLVWVVFGAVSASACSEDDVRVGQPVSEACLECLSERTERGCAEQYATCEEFRSCDDYVLCQLSGRCFERPSGSGCEDEIACELPPNVSPVDAAADGGALEPTPRQLARAFEGCARSTCAATCGFVE